MTRAFPGSRVILGLRPLDGGAFTYNSLSFAVPRSESMKLSARRLSSTSSADLPARSWSRRRDLLCFFK
jgi:hypothetical protein